jgi:gamma-glutamyl-gamma-aminobutyrate hydrolase PuuD
VCGNSEIIQGVVKVKKLPEKYVLEVTPQGCGQLFDEHGIPTIQEGRLKEFPETIALVVFTGGHDVSPSLYGEPTGRYTHASMARDIHEGKMFDLALKHKIPMVGICRGSQFLCVKAGGKLAQDINNHSGVHTFRTNDGRLLKCNSSHHQMQLPPKDAIPLGWAEPRISYDRITEKLHYLNGHNQQIEVPEEYEVVYYPNINAVGVQFHPEWSSCPATGIEFAKEVVNKYLFNMDKK